MAAMDQGGSQYEEYVPETSSSKLRSFGKGKLAKVRYFTAILLLKKVTT